MCTYLLRGRIRPTPQKSNSASEHRNCDMGFQKAIAFARDTTVFKEKAEEEEERRLVIHGTSEKRKKKKRKHDQARAKTHMEWSQRNRQVLAICGKLLLQITSVFLFPSFFSLYSSEQD